MKPYDIKQLDGSASLEGQTEEEIQQTKDKNYANEKEKFIRTLSLLESSGGKDMNHKMINSGMHAGTSAIGTYGLMPNTIKEFANRVDSPEIKELAQLPYPEMKRRLEQDKELERKAIEPIADFMLKRFPDPRMASYAYFQGHNLPVERVAKEYRGTPRDEAYLQKYLEAERALAEEENRKQAKLADQEQPAQEPGYINKIRSFFTKK
jgi:hypothetical protein